MDLCTGTLINNVLVSDTSDKRQVLQVVVVSVATETVEAAVNWRVL